MAESKAKKSEKKEKGKDENVPMLSLQELILNKRTGKYEVIEQMSFWAKHLRKMEEHRHLTQTEILELAMQEILSGRVSAEDVDKMMAGDAAKAKKEAVEKTPKK